MIKLEKLVSKGRILVDKKLRPVESGEEVLVVSSHVDARYTSIGKFSGRRKEGDVVFFDNDGYNNFILEDTITLPVEINVEERGTKDYSEIVVSTIRESGIHEGKTGHSYDLGAVFYKILDDDEGDSQ